MPNLVFVFGVAFGRFEPASEFLESDAAEDLDGADWQGRAFGGCKGSLGSVPSLKGIRC